MSEYRHELPDGMPESIKKLPVHRGYPVPWFVAWLGEKDGEPVALERGHGEPDFRILDPRAVYHACRDRLCWVCGQPMAIGSANTFVIGPMCAINRVSAEPPSHEECAVWSARACPFLSRPHMERREAGLPIIESAPGIMLHRNPGVTLLWTSYGWRIRPVGPGQGVLFDVGFPRKVRWLREGREATREEVMESIDSGLPNLVAMAQEEPGGVDELTAMLAEALVLVPEEEPHARVSAQPTSSPPAS